MNARSGIFGRRVAVIGLILLGVASCQEDATYPTESPAELSDAAQKAAAADTLNQSQDPNRPAEWRSMQFAQQISGFGGAAFDSMGNLQVYLANARNNASVNAAKQTLYPLLQEWRDSPRKPASARREIIIRQGEYSFLKLRQWRDRLFASLFSIDGVISLDLDERTNRIVVGINPSSATAARPAVESTIASFGVPRGAVVITEEAPLIMGPSPASASSVQTAICPAGDDCGSNPPPSVAYITDRLRPVRGGTQIETIAPNNYESRCTLGFVAFYGSSIAFAVASHCTGLIAAVENASIFQASRFYDSHFIGREFIDPPFTHNNGLPSTFGTCGISPLVGVQCRRSDMALISSTTADVYLGYLARPRIYDYVNGPKDIDPNRTTFRIIGERGGAPQTYFMEKIGRTTGWTYGSVGPICKDIKPTFQEASDNRNPSNIVFRCQHFINGGGQAGDSGGPVFELGYTLDTVYLAGIVLGGTGSGFYYSSMDMIRLDLGLPVSDRTQLKTYR